MDRRQVQVFDTAIRWVSQAADGTVDSAALFAWLAESPRHVEELNFAIALIREIADLSADQIAEIEVIAGEATRRHELPASPVERALPDNVVSLLADSASKTHEAPTRGSSRRTRFLALALAAGVCALAFAALWNLGAGGLGWHTYATRTGEQRTLRLADGSLVQLNTRSTLKVRFSDAGRELQLIQGEALFSVEHDAHRPFRVHTADAVIQAIGTEFNVYQHDQTTRVSVLEGVVRVSSNTESDPAVTGASVSAGERVEVRAGGGVERTALNPTDAVAWRHRRLVFHNDTLGDIADEFNRYNHSPQIRVEGNSARSQRFAGTFDADAPEALIAALRSNRNLVIEAHPNRIVIRTKP